MSAASVASDVLLGLTVVVVAGSVLGVVVMPDVYRKLHYVFPTVLVAPPLAFLAVAVQNGLDEATAQSALALGIVVVSAPFLSHATVRAARIRERGDWADAAAGTRRGGRRGQRQQPGRPGAGSGGRSGRPA